MSSYQIPDSIKSDLNLIAERKSLSISRLIDEILTDFLKQQSSDETVFSERRAFPRKDVNNQAVIQLNMSPRSFNYRSVTVKDISMGGLLVQFSNEHAINKKLKKPVLCK